LFDSAERLFGASIGGFAMASVPQKTNGGTTVSFGNTPQASDDLFGADQTGLSDGNLGTVLLDVMADDGGGNAKSLWSLDDGTSAPAPTTNGNYSPSDLLAKDAPDAANYSAGGATIKITAEGKVSYDASTLSDDFKSDLQHLGVGETMTDSFTYAIRLGNGTLSWATAEVQIAGTNDGPEISVVGDGEGENPDDSDSANLIESDAALDASGTLTVTDIDDSDEVAVSVIGATGSVDSGYDIDTNEGLDEPALLAFFSVDPALLDADFDDVSNLAWAFDSTPEAFDFLQGDETLTLTYTIEADDGHGLANSTATRDVTITISGTNDLAAFSGDDDGDVFEDGVELAAGTLVVADADHDESTFTSTSNLAGSYGTFTFNLGTGEWSYDLDNDNLIVQGLNAADPALTETLIVTSADASTHNIVVTIHGADELGGGGGGPTGPTIADPFTGAGDPNDHDGDTATATTANWNATSGDDVKVGNGGDNTINGGNDDDILYGGAGNDTLNGNNDNDTLYGQAGTDGLSGGNGTDALYGGSGDDTLGGGSDPDALYGGSGSDTINGAGQSDTIVGGYGADVLTGGQPESDRFVFLSTSDTGDTITDFQEGVAGDILDFSAIDASTAAGFQTFGAAFADTAVHANGINYFQDGANTVVWAETDGNTATVEFQVTLLDTTAAALASGNFDLVP
jgi:VCBS repeat-containing protein